DDLATYVSRVAAVTPEAASRAAEQHMPGAGQVAIVVVGKAAEIRPALESRFGPVRVVSRDACDTLTPEEQTALRAGRARAPSRPAPARLGEPDIRARHCRGSGPGPRAA